MRLFALTAVAVLAGPVFAQSDAEPAPLPEPVAPPVTYVTVPDTLDADLVGEWTLEEVAEAGRLEHPLLGFSRGVHGLVLKGRHG